MDWAKCVDPGATMTSPLANGIAHYSALSPTPANGIAHYNALSPTATNDIAQYNTLSPTPVNGMTSIQAWSPPTVAVSVPSVFDRQMAESAYGKLCAF